MTIFRGNSFFLIATKLYLLFFYVHNQGGEIASLLGSIFVLFEFFLYI